MVFICTIYDTTSTYYLYVCEIESCHDVNSILYMRDIKGMRGVNGLIFRDLQMISVLKKFGLFKREVKGYHEINLGIDFCGSD